jgi:molybdopterin/thiamine biosynthesis adenylyltransferase
MTSDLFTESDSAVYSARILDEDNAADREVLAELRTDPRIEFVDRRDEQDRCLRGLRPAPERELLAEPTRWGYYPWRRSVVGLLGPGAYRRVRLDRNRNLITAEEQARLGALRIGIVGLSVGHVIAHTVAAEGVCGELRLADFDELELSNLNRVPATVFDLGVNKATLAARRIAELDPYLRVTVLTSGLTQDTLVEFLDGLDIVVEECDSLDMKAMVREAARARRLPVLMATSDRGLMDVERFDLEPTRPILHGLLGDVDWSLLSGLSMRDKVPYLLKCLEVAQSSPRAAASMVEVGNTLSSWPQLATDVTLGAAAVTEAVRRIGLGQPLASGRVRADIAEALDHLEQPAIPGEPAAEPEPGPTPDQSDPFDIVAAAASRAPSAGNAQPWRFESDEHSVTISLAPELSSTADIEFRGSAVAVGAAVFNARVAAAAHGMLGPVDFDEDISSDGDRSPLRAVLRRGDGDDPGLAGLHQSVLQRETNRRHGNPGPIDDQTAAHLQATARAEGAQLRLLTSADEIEQAAGIVAAADRIRYLTPRLHAEMIHELRWPGDASADTGIDIHSLGLDSSDLAVLDILRRPDVMASLADWDAGMALGDDSRDRVRASSGLAVVSVHGQSLIDYARGGAAAESAWVAAQQHGLAVHPITPLFMFARDDDDLATLSPAFATELRTLQHAFHELTGISAAESPVLVLRLFYASPASVRSRRRPFHLALD